MKSSFKKFSIFLAVASAVIGFLFTRVSLLNVIGYESGAAAAFLLMIFSCVLGVTAGRSSRNESVSESHPALLAVGRNFASCIIAGTVYLAIIFAIVAGNTYFADGCNVGPGALLFFFMTVPAIIHFSAFGLFCGRVFRSGTLAAAACFLYVLATTVLSLMEFLHGQHQVVHNLVIGIFSLSGFYGFELVIPDSFYIYRTLVVFWAFFFIGLSILRNPDGNTRPPVDVFVARCLIIPTLLSFLFCAIFIPDQTGLGSGVRSLNHELAMTRESANSIIHYSSGTFNPGELAEASAYIEWYLYEITDALDMELPWKVHVYIYRDDNQMARHTNARDFYFSQPWNHSLHIQKWSIRRSITKHELTHTVMGAVGTGIFGTPYNIGVVEGIAVAVEENYFRGPQFQEEFAAALEADVIAGANQTISNVGFGGADMWKSYNMAGGFTGFLINIYGTEKYKNYYAAPDAEKIYGKSLAQLNGEWKEWLQQVEVSPYALQQAGFYYSDVYFPPFYKTACPRVGERHPQDDPRKEIFHADAQDNYEKSAVLCEQIYQETEDPKWLLESACRLVKAGSYGAASQKAARAAAAEKVTPAVRDKAFSVMAYAEFKQSKFDDTATVLERKKEFGFSHPETIERIQMILAMPDSRELLMKYYLDKCERHQGHFYSIENAIDNGDAPPMLHGEAVLRSSAGLFPKDGEYLDFISEHTKAFIPAARQMPHTALQILNKAGDEFLAARRYRQATKYFRMMKDYSKTKKELYEAERLVEKTEFFRVFKNDDK